MLREPLGHAFEMYIAKVILEHRSLKDEEELFEEFEDDFLIGVERHFFIDELLRETDLVLAGGKPNAAGILEVLERLRDDQKTPGLRAQVDHLAKYAKKVFADLHLIQRNT